MRDDAGDVVGFVGTITDISIRKEAEAARDRRTAELQAIFDAAPVGINLAHDPECRVITGNRTLAEMVGMPLGANVSKSRADAENVPYVVLREGEVIPVEGLPMQAPPGTGSTSAMRSSMSSGATGAGSRSWSMPARSGTRPVPSPAPSASAPT